MTAKAKVLVVDDDAINREIMQEILEEHYQVEYAADGFSALATVRTFQPDIVLLDIMMPGMDGYEACSQMRNIDVACHTKIILVSAKAMLSERIRGYDAGADDYIIKPFDPGELLAKVQVFVRLKRVEEVDSLKSNILNVLRHETRTPLTGILSAAELLRDDATLSSAQQAEWIDVIVRGAHRLHDFLEKGTLLCGYRAGTVAVPMSVFDLNNVVQQCVNLAMDDAKGRLITLNVETATGTWVRGNPEHVRLVCGVLIGNALEYSPEGREVSITTAVDAQEVTLSVTDHGRGIDAKILPRIFDGFETEDIDNHGGGPGLDLALSRAVVQYHGGHIDVESQPGLRTTFTIALPRCSKSLSSDITLSPVEVEGKA